MDAVYRERMEQVLFPRLCCVRCDQGTLRQQSCNFPGEIPGLRLAERHLKCTSCEEIYPITEDDIPVMWTEDLRSYLFESISTSSALHANIRVYDQVADQYWEHARTKPIISHRVRNAARHLLETKEIDPKADGMLHLDFGCGPGQVLGWVREFGLTQVGLDVSLSNLRAARRYTGALVVCADATCMPFRSDTFDLVTESSVLHHIEQWQSAVKEACRICNGTVGVLLDSEPTREQMSYGPLARAVLASRYPVYRALSTVLKQKVYFVNSETARLSRVAEYHHQPGKGFDVGEVKSLFQDSGFNPHLILAPTSGLESKMRVSWKGAVLNLLSFRNPWNPRLGGFTVMARRAA